MVTFFTKSAPNLPADSQNASWTMVKDPNAQISVISGSWAIPLFQLNQDASDIRARAAELQRIESDHLAALRSPYVKARVRIWTLAEFIETPMEALQAVLDEMGGQGLKRITEAPKMVDLKGFAQFLQNLKNQGMHPYLIGDFPNDIVPETEQPPTRKPYLVR